MAVGCLGLTSRRQGLLRLRIPPEMDQSVGSEIMDWRHACICDGICIAELSRPQFSFNDHILNQSIRSPVALRRKPEKYRPGKRNSHRVQSVSPAHCCISLDNVMSYRGAPANCWGSCRPSSHVSTSLRQHCNCSLVIQQQQISHLHPQFFPTALSSILH
jgi:hypothetical protein